MQPHNGVEASSSTTLSPHITLADKELGSIIIDQQGRSIPCLDNNEKKAARAAELLEMVNSHAVELTNASNQCDAVYKCLGYVDFDVILIIRCFQSHKPQ